jgi:hypothetical protein
MKATNFKRNDCKVGRKRRTYNTLTREWRCNNCGGRIVERWNDKRGWHACCGVCGSIDFVHEMQLYREKREAEEVLEGLPPELAAVLE